ncbi:MAG: hypothetical protein HEP71_11390 [Roseivirga sp.]|nr:hypothetical protein [Roseivirga sp.]
MLSNKKLLLSLLLVTSIAVVFWMGSRYPALDEKAMMGGDAQVMGIAFDEWIEVKPGASWWEEILYNTLNWGYTNKQGMTFGLLFAAALMLLFSQLNQYLSENRVTNTFIGLLMGAPLGVCVNCAAPIAQGVRKSGGRAETALSMMISSPSLNIIVLSMLFAMFPLYIVLLKVGITVVIIVILVPLITRFFFKEALIGANTAAIADKTSFQIVPFDLNISSVSQPDSWLHALKWLVVVFLRAGWYIIRKTLPLMVLAGLLGNVLITFLPFDTLSQILPEYGMLPIVAAMIVLAIVGTFLPVPIAFDVIVAAILYNAGLPIQYVMILLLSLGTYSIYAFFIVQQSVSFKVASALYVGVAVFAVMSGTIGYFYDSWSKDRMRDLYATYLTQDGDTKLKELGLPAIEYPIPDQGFVSDLLHKKPVYGNVQANFPSGISVSSRSFIQSKPGSGFRFRKVEGMELGINESQKLTLANFIEPFSYGHSIASGDVHGDGWTDILLSSDQGLSLYANINGTHFKRQWIDTVQYSGKKISTAALVDLNNDGWLDIYYTTYMEGNYILFNKNGRFPLQQPTPVPTVEDGVITIASSFGDTDRDGDLDILSGNMSVGQLLQPDLALPSSRNALVIQDPDAPGGFELKHLSGKAGESWTALISDVNDDGWPDLLAGNDFRIPDNYYLGKGNGDFEQVKVTDSIFSVSTKLTMSITTADINNDLHTDVYFGGATTFLSEPEDVVEVSENICNELANEAERKRCIEKTRIHENLKLAKVKDDVFGCPPEYFEECLVFYLFSEYKWYPEKNQKLCEFIKGWEYYSFLCDYTLNDLSIKYSDESWALEIPQAQATNVLHMGNEGKAYKEAAEKYGIKGSGWSWNSKFADLDNDGWQDLYVVNSSYQGFKRDDKFLFRNKQGEQFEDVTAEVGLESFFAISAYTYLDIDNDGDLDIIAVPAQAPVFVYLNESRIRNSIAFQLDDAIGNSFGIGSKIIIRYGDKNEHHQMRELQSGGGFRSYDTPEFRFGLGDHEKVTAVEIRWSTGEVTILDAELPSGATYKLSRQRAAE